MKASLVALVLGGVCAAAHGGQPEADPLPVDLNAALPAGYDGLESDLVNKYWQQHAYQAVRAPADTAGWHWQFDAGMLDGVHKIVGFWPSVHWLNASNTGFSMASLGYTWRNLKLEGALFKMRDTEQNANMEIIRLDSATKRLIRKKRLSYTFGPNWDVQLSRGLHESPDQLRRDQKVRRTTASASYRSTAFGNPWNTTLAWGRGRGLSGATGNAYLLESAMHIGNQHTVFSRFERAGNDELFREEEASHKQSYLTNKITMGYLYDVKQVGPGRLAIGGLVSRRIVPDELLRYYGSNNTSYMVFFRLNMQFAAN